MQRINFKNLPDTSTPLNASTLNALQDNIEDCFEGNTSMGSIIVEDIQSKNMFNIDGEIKTGTSTSYTVDDDEITIVGIWHVYQIIKVKPNTNYSVSFNKTSEYGSIGVYSKTLGTVISQYSSQNFSFNSGNYEEVALVISTSGNGSTSRTVKFDSIQFEKGTTATDYVGYKDFTNNDIYSTDEIKIGTWIDGKPLYRKTFTGSLVNNGTKEFDSGLTNENITKLYGVATENSTGFTLPIPHVNTSSVSNGIRIDYVKSTHKLNVLSGNNLSDYTAYATIEYTKTTD